MDSISHSCPKTKRSLGALRESLLPRGCVCQGITSGALFWWHEASMFSTSTSASVCGTAGGAPLGRLESKSGNTMKPGWGKIWLKHHLHKKIIIIANGLNMFKPTGSPTLHETPVTASGNRTRPAQEKRRRPKGPQREACPAKPPVRHPTAPLIPTSTPHPQPQTSNKTPTAPTATKPQTTRAIPSNPQTPKFEHPNLQTHTCRALVILKHRKLRKLAVDPWLVSPSASALIAAATTKQHPHPQTSHTQLSFCHFPIKHHAPLPKKNRMAGVPLDFAENPPKKKTGTNSKTRPAARASRILSGRFGVSEPPGAPSSLGN